MKNLILIVCLVLTSACSTVPTSTEIPLFSTYEGNTYAVLPLPMSALQSGDLVLYRSAGVLTGGILGTRRGAGVFRVQGDGLNLVTAENYVGKLIGKSSGLAALKAETTL